MNTLYLTLKDKILGYKKVYEDAIINSSGVVDLLTTLCDLDVTSMDSEIITLPSTKVQEVKSMLMNLDSIDISLPDSNDIIRLSYSEDQYEINLNTTGGSFVSIDKETNRLSFANDLYATNGHSVSLETFGLGVNSQYMLSDLMTQLSVYVLNPGATIDGAMAMIESQMNSNPYIYDVCDTLKQYMISSSDPASAIFAFISDQKKVLNKLAANDDLGTINFDSDYKVSNTFCIPLKVVAQTAGAFLGLVVSIFNPVLGAAVAGLTYVASKAVDYVRENLGTTSVSYLDHHDTPTYAQPLFQYRSKVNNQDMTIDISDLITEFNLDMNTSWILKTYWFGICFYIWNDPDSGNVFVEGYLIPLWYPVREGGGNVAYEGDDPQHTLASFWPVLKSFNIPVKFSVNSDNLPQFTLEATAINQDELQRIWDAGQISPSQFTTLSDSRQVEAINQSLFWLGLFLTPSVYLGTGTQQFGSFISYDAKALYNDQQSIGQNPWKLAFAMSLSTMMEYDYINAPIFSINRNWGSAPSTFAELQEYLVFLKDSCSKAITIGGKSPNVVTSSTCMLTKFSPNCLLTNARQSCTIVSDVQCKGTHLTYPPQYSHKVWLQAIAMLAVGVAVVAGAMMVKRTIKRKIKAAAIKKQLALQQQKQQLMSDYAQGKWSASNALAYARQEDKYAKWSRILKLENYDYFATSSTLDDGKSSSSTLKDAARTIATSNDIYRVITGSDLPKFK